MWLGIRDNDDDNDDDDDDNNRNNSSSNNDQTIYGSWMFESMSERKILKKENE